MTMDQALRNKLRDTVLKARNLLETSINEILQGRFGIYPAKDKGPRTRDIVVEDDERMGHLESDERETRGLLLDHLDVLQKGGLAAASALDTFVRETAFTWLNRFVAFKMCEVRGLVRETVSRLENSNGFKMWLAEPGNETHLSDYEKGDLPQNSRGEGPRQLAYRAFVLAQCRKLSEEVRVLFDPDALVSRFLPQPKILKELANLLNAPDLAPAWQPGNEETIGWVYQGFNSEELEQAFREIRVSKKKFESRDIPAVTQLFTPRWIVRFLVQNTLGRLWLELHPDSKLASSLDYLVPLPTVHRRAACATTTHRRAAVHRQAACAQASRLCYHHVKSVKDITFLDPACGTMHFGLVAFDLFVAMYREEMQNAGKPGWPEKPPVASEEQIPNAIIAHNIHGIDIDLRAVQLSALTLYLKAKTLNPKARISESRLACANVHMLDSDNLKDFVEQMKFGLIYQRILTTLQERLKYSEQLGSLLRLEKEIRELVAEERKRYKPEDRQLVFPELLVEQFKTEAGQREFWKILEAQIGQVLDAFAREYFSGAHQTFFAGETAKGLRLLELMAQRYDVVVTNPPYMTSRNMNPTLKDLVSKQYPITKGDLYACFIQRCSEWLFDHGRLGMIAQQSFMFISSYEKLREHLLSNVSIEVISHIGPRAFEEVTGEKVNSVLFVFRRENDPKARQNAIGTYFRLVKEPDSEAKRQRFKEAVRQLSLVNGHFSGDPQTQQLWTMDQGQIIKDDGPKTNYKGQMTNDKGSMTKDKGQIIYHYRQSDFDAIPGSPWVYWITPGLRKVFETFPKLGKIAQPRVGLQTGDNFRFLRYWWEVGTGRIGFGCTSAQNALKTGKRWFPYMKGGGFCRWYGNQEYVVNWEKDGKEIKKFADPVTGKTYSRPQNTDYYFRRGVTWTDLTSGRFSARLSPGGFIFDVSGSCCFPEDIELILGLMNSTFAQFALKLLNPTVHVQVGDLARLPVPESSSDKLRNLVDQAIALAKADSEEDETTWDFIAPPDWPDGIRKVAERHSQLTEIERQIDEEVYRLYGISEEDRRAIEEELSVVNGSLSIEETEDPQAIEDEDSFTNDQGPMTKDQQLAKAWISYAVGVVMGQFEPGKENGLGRGRFNTETVNMLQALKDEDGLLVVDPGHPEDLAAKAFAALEVIFGEVEAESLIRQALDDNGEPLALLRDYLAYKFFKEHIQKYRKRPIYWYLRSARGNYGLWLYYHRLDKDILFKALLNYVEPKIRQVSMQYAEGSRQLDKAKENKSETKEIRRIEKEMDRLDGILSELRDFEKRLRHVANLHLDFDLNDGVILNMAPLWELVPWNEPKKYWEELQEGKYDWAHIAYKLWPERVQEACKKDRSIAIAHGLEHLCEAKGMDTKRKGQHRRLACGGSTGGSPVGVAQAARLWVVA
uniref:site-specific DNA-methyltransferase (adenine-specific) n=1 Tax=Desulfomonile tiedjei TaxID=2358 RepID=A0A7C4EYT0_9BACT